jgi:hypothetical protein
MQRYHQEGVRYCSVTGDQAFRAPLHLVTRSDLESPVAARFRKTLLAFVGADRAVRARRPASRSRTS